MAQTAGSCTQTWPLTPNLKRNSSIFYFFYFFNSPVKMGDCSTEHHQTLFWPSCCSWELGACFNVAGSAVTHHKETWVESPGEQ